MIKFTHFKHRRGISLTGYGLLVGLIAVVGIATTQSIGESTNSLFGEVGTEMGDVVASTQAAASTPEPTPVVDCVTARPSCQDHLLAGCTTDGAYSVDPDGGSASNAHQLMCDMTTDDGGWTLVFKDSGANSLPRNDATEQGTPDTCLNSTADTCSSKLSDADINLIAGTGSGQDLAYRVTSPDIANQYYFSSECVYQHSGHNNNLCRKYTASYTSDANPTYIQCGDWGGDGGGLDAWWSCGGSSGYSNVAVTHRSTSYAESSGITTNSSGSSSGSSSSTYGNTVHFWVR